MKYIIILAFFVLVYADDFKKYKKSHALLQNLLQKARISKDINNFEHEEELLEKALNIAGRLKKNLKGKKGTPIPVIPQQVDSIDQALFVTKLLYTRSDKKEKLGELPKKLYKIITKAYVRARSRGALRQAMIEIDEKEEDNLSEEKGSPSEKIRVNTKGLKKAEINRKADELFMTGIENFKNKKYDMALAYWDVALELDFNHKLSSQYLDRLANILDLINKHKISGIKKYKNNKFESAIKEFVAVFSYTPNDQAAAYYLYKAIKKISKKNRKKLIKVYLNKKPVLKIKNKIDKNYQLLSRNIVVLFLDPGVDEAMKNIIRVREKINSLEYANQVKDIIASAKEYEKEGDLVKAKYYYTLVLSIDKNNQLAQKKIPALEKIIALQKEILDLIARGRRAYQSGDLFSSLSLYQAVLNRASDNTTAKKMIIKIKKKLQSIQQSPTRRLTAARKHSKMIYRGNTIRGALLFRKFQIFQYERAGNNFLAIRDFYSAKRIYEKLLFIDPQNVLANRDLIIINEGVKGIKQNLNIRFKIKHYLKEAGIHIKVGNYKKALEKYRLILLYDPNHKQAQKGVKKQESNIIKQKKIKKESILNEKFYLLGLGIKYFKEKKFNKAARILEDFLNFDKKNKTAEDLLYLSKHYLLREQYGEGEKGSYAIVKLQGLYKKGTESMLRGEYINSISVWEKILDDFPANNRAVLYFRICSAHGKYTDYKKFLSRHYKKALLLIKSQQDQLAQIELEMLIKLEPGYRDTKNHLEKLKKNKNAIETRYLIFNKNIKRRSAGKARDLLEIGMWHYGRKNYKRALLLIDKALALSPGYIRAEVEINKIRYILSKR